jgi:hypothetical protein
MGMTLVTWWCTTIGITNLGAIQVAAGVVAGGSLILFGFMIFSIVVGALLMMRAPEDAKRTRGGPSA